MRILVYGAGVQGCELAHRLLQNKKNVVTMLARGEWKERLDQRGLVIRHWAQCRTTVDRVATIDTLAPDDCYDLVFVAVQAGQLPDVLPILKQNKSEYFVFVGNDPHAVEVMQAMQRPADKVAFGFQSSGGHRDVDKVVSAHVGVDMTVGGATAPLSGVFRYRLKTAFEGAKYKLNFVSDMDAWLKCHIALILLSLLRLQGRPLQGHQGAAGAGPRCRVGGLRDAQGCAHPGGRQGEHRLLPRRDSRTPEDGRHAAGHLQDPAGPSLRLRPRDARRG